MNFAFEQVGTEALFALAHSVGLSVDRDGNVALVLAVDDDREVAIGGGAFKATCVMDGVIATFDDVTDLASAVRFLGAPRSEL